mmetsp:Transcript_7372/g.12730  ORF Transcript_7372/g.12730 Transcript_7372/m.12730 type:complete len:419 (+) Transcript_7372:2350-3606(+)
MHILQPPPIARRLRFSEALELAAVASRPEHVLARDVGNLGLLVLLELRALRDAMAEAAAVGAPARARHLEGLLVQVHGVVQRGQYRRHPLLRLLEQVLEIEQHRLGLVAVDESGSDARLAAPTGTTDAMDVVLNLVRHVVVDHVLDVREVQTLGGDVGGDEHVPLARLEGVDGPLALLLVHAAVDCTRLHALKQQVLVDVVHVGLVLAEDQHRRRRLLKALQQVHDLGLLLDVLHLLDDIQVGSSRAADVDDDGVHQRALCELADLHGHGGAEEERLPLRLEVPKHLADVLLEAQIHHAIGLVQTQVPALLQCHALLVQQILQPPGRRHAYVQPLPDYLTLQLGVDAAHAKHSAHLIVFSRLVARIDKLIHHFVCLPCKLSRWAHHQPHGALVGGQRHPHLLLQSTHDHRQRKRHRLP